MSLAAPTIAGRQQQRGEQADLAAVVLRRRDGTTMVWRADGLDHDPDVTAWARTALDADQPGYASLWLDELASIRLRR